MRAILVAGSIGLFVTASLGGDYGVDLDQPGWVRVAIPEPWSAVEVRSPSGVSMASHYLAAPTEPFEPQLVRSQAGPKGWEFTFDLGPAPVEHSALRIRTKQRGTAAGCELRSSEDPEQFQLLARADLVWLGSSAALQRDRIEYAATSARFVQLVWPKSAGEPTFESIAIEPTPKERQRHLELSLPIDSQQSQAHLAEHYDRIDSITLHPTNNAGAAQVVFLSAPARFWSVCLRDTIAPYTVPRSQCEGSVIRWLVEPPAPVERVSVRAPQRWVVFEASAPGRYRLSSPAPGNASPSLDAAWLGQPMLTMTAAPIAAATPAPIEELLVAPRPVQFDRPQQSWPIEIPATALQQPVRLVLSNEVIEAVRGDLHRLGLRQGAHAVPFLRQTDSAPLIAWTQRGRAALDVELPPSAGMITQLELRSIDPGLTSRQWTLILDGAIPQRVTLERSRPEQNIAGPVTQFHELRVRAGQTRMRLEGLDESEIEALQLTLWREQESLLFVAPSGEPVRLTDGFDPLPVPFPELELRRAWWSDRAQRVSTGPKLAESAAGWETWKRPILIAAQALVGIGLLILLRRVTRRG